MSVEVRVGQTWKMDVGGHPFRVVYIVDGIAGVKDARAPKKDLANPAGARLMALSKFTDHRLLEDVAE